jgi:hypothetical protein
MMKGNKVMQRQSQQLLMHTYKRIRVSSLHRSSSSSSV